MSPQMLSIIEEEETYWIAANEEHVLLLLEAGVEVGPFDPAQRIFENCVIPIESLPDVEKYHPMITWGKE